MCLYVGITAKCVTCHSVSQKAEFLLVQCPESSGEGPNPSSECMGPHAQVPGDHLVYHSYCTTCWLVIPDEKVCGAFEEISRRINNTTLEEARRRFEGNYVKTQHPVLIKSLRTIMAKVKTDFSVRRSLNRRNTKKENDKENGTVAGRNKMKGAVSEIVDSLEDDGWLKIDIRDAS